MVHYLSAPSLQLTYTYRHLLLVNGEVISLDIKHSAATETEHILRVEIPGYAVSIWLLIEKFLRSDIVHLENG